MAVSDTLWEAEEDIRDYQDHGVICSHDDHRVNLVVDIMRAVRLQPGRDRLPDAPDVFEADLHAALARYFHATLARHPPRRAPREEGRSW